VGPAGVRSLYYFFSSIWRIISFVDSGGSPRTMRCSVMWKLAFCRSRSVRSAPARGERLRAGFAEDFFFKIGDSRYKLVSFRGANIGLDAADLRVERDDLIFHCHVTLDVGDIVRKRGKAALYPRVEAGDLLVGRGDAFVHAGAEVGDES